MQPNHFELVKYLKTCNKEFRNIVDSLSSIENETNVIKLIEMEFQHFFIKERTEIIKFVIRGRFKIIRDR